MKYNFAVMVQMWHMGCHGLLTQLRRRLTRTRLQTRLQTLHQIR